MCTSSIPQFFKKHKKVLIINRLYSEMSFTPPKRAKVKYTDNTNDRWDCRATGSFTCWWGCKIMWTLWRNVGSYLWGVMSREMKTHVPQKTTWMIMTALFIIAPTWKHPKYSSTGEWINILLLWYIHAMKYYSSIKRKSCWWHSTTWMSLGNMLYERSQTQKRGYLIIHYLKPKTRKTHLCW